jgi:hypothetical protein
MSPGAVDRGDREIAALGSRPVGEVAAVIFAHRVGRQLDVVELEARGIVAVLEADVVEHEEFGFRADIDGVADAAGLDEGFGAGGRRARVAAIKLAGRRLDDIAHQDQHRRRAERVDIGGAEVRLQNHVALVDRLPAGDRRAVEHEAIGQHVLVDRARDHGEMLPLALGVGEPEVHPFDLIVGDLLQHLARVRCHFLPLANPNCWVTGIPAGGTRVIGSVNFSRPRAVARFHWRREKKETG